jgi:hypothetical protein
MFVHNHSMRYYCSGALGLSVAVILLGSAYTPSRDFELAAVTGQVTCANHPASEMVVFFEPVDRGHLYAVGRVHPDGSFDHLYTNSSQRYEGVIPGRYRVFFRPFGSAALGSSVDSKYLDVQTSDLVVDVGSGWNYVRFALH